MSQTQPKRPSLLPCCTLYLLLLPLGTGVAHGGEFDLDDDDEDVEASEVPLSGPEALWGDGPSQGASAPTPLLYEEARRILRANHDAMAPLPLSANSTASRAALSAALPTLRKRYQAAKDRAEPALLLGLSLLALAPEESLPQETEKEAFSALLRAESLGAISAQGMLALSWLRARAGRLDEALDGCRTLLSGGLRSPLLLRRTADILMARGDLSEATTYYERLCQQARPGNLDAIRGCFGLAVAHERADRKRKGTAALRQGLRYDPTQRSLRAADYIPPEEGTYYRAVVAQRQGVCTSIDELRAYVQSGVRSPYRLSAEARLADVTRSCKGEYSPLPEPTPKPLGSTKDRDGGASWRMRPDAAPK